MKRRQFLQRTATGVAGWLACSSCPVLGAEPKASRPNVIFILTDDMGFGDGKVFGHPYMKTPTLDRLAKEGTVFQHFYVSGSVCSPSRAAFMTGHYPARHHVHGHFASEKRNAQRKMPNYLDPKAFSLARFVKANGYVTGHFGKWHLCGGGKGPEPSAYGYDAYRTRFAAGEGDTYASEAKQPYWRARSTQAFVDDTLEFIRKNKGKPFYVNLWTLVPHATLRPTKEELAVYKDLKVDPADFPPHMRTYIRKAKNPDQQMRVYCAAMTGMDKALGNLLKGLDKLGLADNTLIFFTSDNGPEDYMVRNAANAGMGHPGPHLGRKRSIRDGGVRMSCVARWPGKVPAGKVNTSSIIAAVDWVPTVAALVGAALPGGYKPDGENILDVLKGARRQRTGPLFWEWRFALAHPELGYRPPQLAIRDRQWKAYVNPDGSKLELYDIVKDPAEEKNLADRTPEIASRLKSAMLKWKRTLPK